MGRSSRRVTQAEVARQAGVSQAMVSLVVNGSDSVRVTPETRRRVEDALRRTGYTVDVLGRRLRGKSNQLLGVFTYESVFPSGSGDFYLPFLGGIEEEAEHLGYDLILFTSPGRRDGRRHVYEQGSNRLGIADGCILLGRHTDRDELARLLEERFPFVFIGRRESPSGPVSYVGADYAAATGELHEMLWGLGHRQIALVGLEEDSEGTVDRRAGYERARRRHRRRPLHVGADQDPGAVLDSVLELGVTGLLVETTAMAQALADLATSRGHSVPDALSFAVLGDRDPSHALPTESPPVTERYWTSFTIPRREMGRAAVRALVTELEHPSRERPIQQRLPCAVVPGSTVAPAPPR